MIRTHVQGGLVGHEYRVRMPRPPSPWGSIVMAWVTLVALFALVILLSGCDAVTGFGDHVNDQFPGNICRNYAVDQDSRITVQDSTKACADGTAPFFYYADWISVSGECLISATDVVGGVSGIKRTFGCWPKSASPQVVI